MRLTAFFLLIVCIHVSAKGLSQNVTMSLKEVPLSRVFDEISKQTGMSIIYNDDWLVGTHRVSLEVSNRPVGEVLLLCLKGQPLSWQVQNDQIVIRQLSAVPASTEATQDRQDPPPPADLRGHVSDSLGNPLSGASVVIKRSKKGVQTDARGNFVIAGAEPDDILIITYTGFVFQEIRIGTRVFINVVLERSSSPLDQVQIVAYGTQTQRFTVGSVATVTAKEIEQQPVTNPLMALQGRVAGLNVVATSGAPGAAALLQIRGQNTLNGTTSTQNFPFDQPLFIVDGVPFGPQNQNINQNSSLATKVNAVMGNPRSGISPFNDIVPADIESITILKDADATSIYGSQGSNGVVLITTKKGRAGKAHLNVNVQSGAHIVTSPVKMMNTAQYLQMRKEALTNDGLTPGTDANDPGFAPDLTLFDQHKYTDWFKFLEGGVAHNTNAIMSLSGGSVHDNFYLSGGYTHDGYNFPGNFSDDRLSFHSAFRHQSANQRLNVEFGTDYVYDNNNSSGRPDILKAFTLPPNYPDLLDSRGSLVWNYNGFDLGGWTNYLNGVDNPLSYLRQTDVLKNYNLTTHLNIGYRAAKGLSIGVIAGYSRFTSQDNSALPQSTFDPSSGVLSYATFAASSFQTVDITPQIDYHINLGAGELKLLVGSEYKRNISSTTYLQGTNYQNDALLSSISGAATVSAYDDYTEYRYNAGFGKLGYIWKRKYIVSLTGRRDGSSNFGPGRQFGNFGSAGAGWIVSEEPFMKKLPAISYAKLSGSYGTSGSDGIAPYQYQPNWRTGTLAYQGIRPYYAANLFNPDYSWSLTKKINAGLDVGFLKDRFLINITYYQNRSSKQLVSSALPVQTGFSGVLENFAATVQNRGWEGSFSSRNIKTEHFSWSSTFNISGNTNKLISFPGLATSTYKYQYSIGQSVNLQYLWKSIGVDPATGVFQYLGADGKPTFSPTYKTTTSVLNDQYVKEDATPKLIGGLSNTFTYRSFSLTVFLQAAKQRGQSYLYSVYTNWTPGVFGINQPVQLLDVWHQPGDKSGLQRYSTAATDQAPYNGALYFNGSTGAWEDASYIRVKTVALSYELSPAIAKKLGLNTASFYLNAQNLFTITGYKVGDPETQSLYTFPLQRTIMAGINITF